jgi:hypothetical protein
MERAIIPVQVSDRERVFVFATRIPYLPDLLADSGTFATIGNPVFEAYARQIALLRALTAFPSGRCALQVRFLGRPVPGKDVSTQGGTISIAFVGMAQDAETAANLLDLLLHARPPEVQLDVIVDGAELMAWVDPFSHCLRNGPEVLEIRRAVQPVDSLAKGSAIHSDDLIVLPWSWSPHSLTHALDILRAQSGDTLLAVHAEPRLVGTAVFEYLADSARYLTSRPGYRPDSTMENIGLVLCQQRARSLRQAALHVRVLLASEAPMLPGTAEYLGADLTRSSDESESLPQTFTVVRPRTTEERRSALSMVRYLATPIWGVPEGIGSELAELIFLMDPREANCAFRIPVTPRGGLPGIATATAAVAVGRVMRLGEAATGLEASLHLGKGPSIGAFGLTSRDLNEHVLVAGVPGSGKSTTVRSLLARLPQLARDGGIPFLVIDPAKTDYSQLSGLATVYRPVLDKVAFNPLAVSDGASIAGHSSRILAAFDNAFHLSEVFPLARPLLGLALRKAYQDCGRGDIAVAGSRWPTIADLYRHVRAVIVEQSFAPEAASNLRGSLLSRIEFLIDGGLGVSLAGSAADGIDWQDLMLKNTVMELRSFVSPEDRSLLFGLLFSGLVGYREAHPGNSGLVHVTVLEEAHRLLRTSQSAGFASTLFADAIAELRGAGEGFIIVDQAPSGLIPEASKNTGTKIAHRLLDRAERDFMGDAMVLSPGQKADLARLPQGRIFVLGGSLADPALVDIEPQDLPLQSGEAKDSFVRDGSATRPWCMHCPMPCTGARGLSWSPAILSRLTNSLKKGESRQQRDVVSRLMVYAYQDHAGPGDHDVERFCAVAHALSRAYGDDGQMLSRSLALHAQLYRREPKERKPNRESTDDGAVASATPGKAPASSTKRDLTSSV